MQFLRVVGHTHNDGTMHRRVLDRFVGHQTPQIRIHNSGLWMHPWPNCDLSAIVCVSVIEIQIWKFWEKTNELEHGFKNFENANIRIHNLADFRYILDWNAPFVLSKIAQLFFARVFSTCGLSNALFTGDGAQKHTFVSALVWTNVYCQTSVSVSNTLSGMKTCSKTTKSCTPI